MSKTITNYQFLKEGGLFSKDLLIKGRGSTTAEFYYRGSRLATTSSLKGNKIEFLIEKIGKSNYSIKVLKLKQEEQFILMKYNFINKIYQFTLKNGIQEDLFDWNLKGEKWSLVNSMGLEIASFEKQSDIFEFTTYQREIYNDFYFDCFLASSIALYNSYIFNFEIQCY